MTIDPKYGTISGVQPGEIVRDDLTRRNARVLRATFDEHGNPGYWLECDEEEMRRTGGGRFPWEISAPHA